MLFIVCLFVCLFLFFCQLHDFNLKLDGQGGWEFKKIKAEWEHSLHKHKFGIEYIFTINCLIYSLNWIHPTLTILIYNHNVIVEKQSYNRIRLIFGYTITPMACCRSSSFPTGKNEPVKGLGSWERRLRCFRTTVEAPLTDTLVSGQPYLQPPSQNPVLINSVFSHSRKRPAPVTDPFFAPPGCPLTRASAVLLTSLWRVAPDLISVFLQSSCKLLQSSRLFWFDFWVWPPAVKPPLRQISIFKKSSALFRAY